MNDQKLRHELLLALGAISEGQGEDALIAQEAAIEGLILALEQRKRIVSDKRRVMEALRTADQRLQPGDRDYMVHLRHCYGLDYESVMPGEEPVDRHGCKYGEHDICPAAMFEDPWDEYQRIEKTETESG